MFSSPTIFCFNSNDRIKLVKCSDLSGRAIYFSPTLVNNVLTLERINNIEVDVSESEFRDSIFDSVFIYRYRTHH